MRIFGKHLVPSDGVAVRARFGESVVECQSASFGAELVCVTPPVTSGKVGASPGSIDAPLYVGILVSTNGVEFSAGKAPLQFLYRPSVVVSGVSPPWGPGPSRDLLKAMGRFCC